MQDEGAETMLDDLATGADSDVMDAAVDIIYFDFLPNNRKLTSKGEAIACFTKSDGQLDLLPYVFRD